MAGKIIPHKVGPCMTCGKQVTIKTNPKVNCPECRKSTRAVRARNTATKIRRRSGVEQVKGADFICIDCLNSFVRFSHRSVRCKPCQKVSSLERARNSSRRKAGCAEGKEALNKWRREKIAQDPRWAMSERMKVLTHKALKRGKAGRLWLTLVPYTLDEFMRHIERQFLPGMSWQNRGQWHIDHIRPSSSFSFDSAEHPDFKDCWALSNLRPLWATDNLQKNATITYLL